jgi:FKBP-type peptidyl-prolyl cis-trans isomerase SlyD
MAKINKGDFIELEYTGRLKETNEIFDTTDEKTAKDAEIYRKMMKYGAVVVLVGESQVVVGIDDFVIGKEPGEYTVDLIPEKAFGKKDAKLIRMIPVSTFKKQEIMPEPGLQINVDGMLGTVKTAGGGRCLVDFNHPLSGKEVVYSIKIKRIVTDDAEKIKGFLELSVDMKEPEVKIENENAKIISKQEMPKEVQEIIAKKLKEIAPNIKNFEFVRNAEHF